MMETGDSTVCEMTPPRHRFALPLVGHAFGIMRNPVEFQRPGHKRYGPERYESMSVDQYQSPAVGSAPLQFGAVGTPLRGNVGSC